MELNLQKYNIKTGKNLSICVNRISLIGDVVTSLSVLSFFRKMHPECYHTLSIAKKCSQCAQLFFNHPLVDRIHINEFLENPKQEEYDFLQSHDIYANPKIQHQISDWYNYFDIYEENFEMLGIKSSEAKSILGKNFYPTLIKWFNVEKHNRVIGLWPFAGYGKDPIRSPSKGWWIKFLNILKKDNVYSVFHFGYDKEPNFELDGFDKPFYNNFTNLSFFEQIKMSLGTDICVNTDSGSGLILGAYNHPQKTLLTNWYPNHYKNFNSLEPKNINNETFFAENGSDNIDVEKVIQSLKII